MGLELLGRADQLRAAGTPFVLVTVVRAERPASAGPGDRAIVFGDGRIEGFAGGACASATLRVQSARLLRTGGATLLRITPGGDAAAGQAPAGVVVVDNPCLSGGTLEVLLEAVLPPPLLYVFGDSPIAAALAAVGRAAGYDVHAGNDPAAPVPDGAAAVVVAAHGHDELPVLQAALAAGTPYVALVASPRRGAAVLAELGLAADDRQRVVTPAGLDLGARNAGDVAVSILAELIAHRRSTASTAAAPAPGAASAPSGAGVPEPQPEPVLDPVCGMTVAASPASLHAEHAGRRWYFCAAGCRRAFLADPASYTA